MLNILAFLVVFASMQVYANELLEDQTQTIKIPEFLDNLNCSSLVTPLDTVEKVTQHFLCDKEISNSLKSFQKDIPYKNWEIQSEESSEGKIWIVEISGRGLIPSAYCSAKLNKAGEITHRECQYNK